MATGDRNLLELHAWSLVRRTPEGERTILEDVDLELEAGQWLAVLGANGSGKSSLLKFLAGDESPLTVPRAIMFQDPDDQLIAGTVEQERALGRSGPPAAGLLAEFGLAGLAGLDPRLLSAGQKQRLVLAVSLAGGPEVLFCDEPTALQDGQQAEWVLDHLQQWRRATGGTLVTATCDPEEARRADRLLVLKDGRVALNGPRQVLWADPMVEELLGLKAEQETPVAAAVRDDLPGEPVLSLRGVGCAFPGFQGGFTGMDLEVLPGQRVGISGPNGCGKSTLLAMCVGARRPDQGEVVLAGTSLYRNGARDLDHGQALLAPQFPEYIFIRTTVAEEIALDPRLAEREPPRLLAAMGLPADILGRNPHSLSSGQKRRLALGLVLFSGRSLLLLDEPTAALDRRGRLRVLELMRQVPAETGLVVVSHDGDFLRRAGCRRLEMGPEGLQPV